MSKAPRIGGLDHVNIVTRKVADTALFYARVLGLEERDPPSNLDPAQVRWMFDANGRAIFHLSSPGSLIGLEGDERRGSDTGAVHHVALDCTGHDAMLSRLGELGVESQCNHVTEIDLKQIFVKDPNGVLLELNYRAGNH